MDNLPVVKKCCFCVPLRYGLLTWGYLKLVALALALSFFIFIVIVLAAFMREVIIVIILSLVAVLLTTEIIIHIVFIIGTHRKILKLLRAYYYYALFMWIVTIIMSTVGVAFILLSLEINISKDYLIIILMILSFLFYFVAQTFLVLALRSEIIKLRSNCPYRFVKNDNEPEGTITSVKDDEQSSVDNGTMPIL